MKGFCGNQSFFKSLLLLIRMRRFSKETLKKPIVYFNLSCIFAPAVAGFRDAQDNSLTTIVDNACEFGPVIATTIYNTIFTIGDSHEDMDGMSKPARALMGGGIGLIGGGILSGIGYGLGNVAYYTARVVGMVD